MIQEAAQRIGEVQRFVVMVGILILFSLGGCNEKPYVNSKQTVADTTMLIDIYTKGRKFLYINTDSSRYFGSRSLKIADSLELDSWTIKSLNLIGSSHSIDAEYKLALNAYMKALNLALENKDSNNIYGVYNNLGIIHKDLGNFNIAKYFLVKASQYHKSRNDEKHYAIVMSNLSNVNIGSGDYNKAIINTRISLHIYSRLKDLGGIATCMQRIGSAYMHLQVYDSAEFYLISSLNISRTINSEFGMSKTTMLLGTLFLAQHNPEKAEFYLNQSQELCLKNNYKASYTTVLSQLVQLNMMKKDYKESLILTKKLDSLSLTAASYNTKVSQSLISATLYASLNDYERAYTSLLKANKIEDSASKGQDLHLMYNQEISELTLQSQEGRLLVQESDIKIARRNVFILIIWSLLLLVSLISIYLFQRFRNNFKNSLLKIELSNNQIQSQLVIDAELNERRQLGYNLHDGVGPLLSLVKLNLTSIMGNPNTDPQLVQKIRQTSQVLENVIKEVRSISSSMAPPVLFEKGLIEALQQNINSINSAQSMKVFLNIEGESIKIPEYVSYAIYRVIMELINNAVKHSKATHLMVNLDFSNRHLRIHIKDNGIGFDSNSSLHSKGLGLRSVKSRIQNIKGEIKFVSGPNEGTAIQIKVPLYTG